MMRESHLALISGEARGLGPAMSRFLLGCLSIPYGLAVRLRNFCFETGIRGTFEMGVPVISVGNITVGGTGKTPLAEYLARRLSGEGHQVAILSRGYGEPVLEEGDGSRYQNDEAKLLAHNLPASVKHAVDPDRVTAAQRAVAEFHAHRLIMDDGFQHRQLGRDIDIVAIDALCPFGFERLLPRGLLREPVGELARADIFVVTHADLVPKEEISRIIRILAELNAKAPVVQAVHNPTKLVSIGGDGEFDPDWLSGRKIVAVSSIGNPSAFEKTLDKLHADVLKHYVFPDHHVFRPSEVVSVAGFAAERGADAVVCTQKDEVKLSMPERPPVPWLSLRIEIKVIDGEFRLDAALAALKGARRSSLIRPRRRT